MSPEKKVEAVQSLLEKQNIDGWLIFDFHRQNHLGSHFLEIPDDLLVSRRFFYWIPRKGSPIKILHKIEPKTIEKFPGVAIDYLSWQSLEKALQKVLSGAQRVAMEYSPRNAIPYVSLVDGGTIELVKSFGVEVVSSSGILSQFTSVLTEEQIQTQEKAGKHVDWVAAETWRHMKQAIENKHKITEYDVQQFIIEKIEEKGFVINEAPICAVNEHSADPHYAPEKGKSAVLKKGDFVLIDLWCRLNQPKSVYADITRVAVLGDRPTKKQEEVFSIVRKAQSAATDFVRQRVSSDMPIMGYEVDDVCRQVIEDAGYGPYFIHRTGHSIDIELHGSGPHIDNLEMHDERLLTEGMCFSIEPGIYLPGEFGVRLEYDILIRKHQKMDVSGGVEDSLLCLF